MKTKAFNLHKSIHGSLLVGLFTLSLLGTTGIAKAAEMVQAEFNAAAELIRPDGWREWVYVGAPLTPNSLNPPKAAFPEFHSVYIDPQSWAHYQKTGLFRDGTLIAKELTTVGATEASSGKGYFMGEFSGYEIAYKDSR